MKELKYKILCLFFVLLVCFSPITVFADSLYYEVVDDNMDLAIVEINEDRTFVCKDEYGEDITSLEAHLNKKKYNEIMNYFKSHVKEEDRTDYVPGRTLLNYGHNEEGYLIAEGYILRICENGECKEYFSETPIISEDEIAYNEIIREIGKAEDFKFIAPLITSVILILLIPTILVVIVILIIVSKNKKKTAQQNNKTESDW